MEGLSTLDSASFSMLTKYLSRSFSFKYLILLLAMSFSNPPTTDRSDESSDFGRLFFSSDEINKSILNPREDSFNDFDKLVASLFISLVPLQHRFRCSTI